MLKTFSLTLIITLLCAATLAYAADKAAVVGDKGFTYSHGGKTVPEVKATETDLWDGGNFHSIASALTLQFDLDDKVDVSKWKLTVSDQGSGTPLYGSSADIYTRPIISVNGTTVWDGIVMWPAAQTRSFDVGKLLKPGGSNTISITLGGDSRSGYRLSSLKVGP